MTITDTIVQSNSAMWNFMEVLSKNQLSFLRNGEIRNTTASRVLATLSRQFSKIDAAIIKRHEQKLRVSHF